MQMFIADNAWFPHSIVPYSLISVMLQLSTAQIFSGLFYIIISIIEQLLPSIMLMPPLREHDATSPTEPPVKLIITIIINMWAHQLLTTHTQCLPSEAHSHSFVQLSRLTINLNHVLVIAHMCS